MAFTLQKPAPASETEYKNPPAGTFQGVLVDLIDLGQVKKQDMKTGETYERPEFKMVFQLNELNSDGFRYLVSTWGLTYSLSDKSNTRAYIKGMLGRDLTESEMENFDAECLLGTNCLITMIEKAKGDKKYTNIGGFAPLMRGMTPIQPLNYTRKCDRVEGATQAPTTAPAPAEETPLRAAQMDASKVYDKAVAALAACTNLAEVDSLWEKVKPMQGRLAHMWDSTQKMFDKRTAELMDKEGALPF
jgi:hypothetical protein